MNPTSSSNGWRDVVPPEAGQKGHQAHCRAVLYAFFAQMLSPPSAALVEALADGSLRELVEAALAGAPPIHREALAAGLPALFAATPVLAASDALLVEYTHLFGNGVICPHYETEYGGTDVFRAVHVLSSVSAFYHAHGVRVGSGVGERPDYIGVELEFMNLLASKQARAAAQGNLPRVRMARQAQQRFFLEHLGAWAGEFCRALATAARTPFHAALADALAHFVSAEARYLEGATKPS
jgi:TorA maturation chaperone TorD